PLHLYTFLSVTDTFTSSISTLSLHDALPIFSYQPISNSNDGAVVNVAGVQACNVKVCCGPRITGGALKLYTKGPEATATPIFCPDRKSTRLNSSHVAISYAVFCLKKKN